MVIVVNKHAICFSFQCCSLSLWHSLSLHATIDICQVQFLHPFFSGQVGENVHLVILEQTESGTEVVALLNRAIVVHHG